MERLTHKRTNGIKSGYWSPNKKDELVQRLAEYENTGMDPECMKKNEWIPVAEKLPETEDYVLMSFENSSYPAIGRYEIDGEGDGAWCPTLIRLWRCINTGIGYWPRLFYHTG